MLALTKEQAVVDSAREVVEEVDSAPEVAEEAVVVVTAVAEDVAAAVNVVGRRHNSIAFLLSHLFHPHSISALYFQENNTVKFNVTQSV